MTRSNKEREDPKVARPLLRMLTAHYNSLALAHCDESILRQYSALLRYLRSRPDVFLDGRTPTKRHDAESIFSPTLFEQGLQTASLDDLQILVNDQELPRKLLERVAIERFSVPQGSIRSYSNKQELVEKLRSLIDNERTHQIIGAVARGDTKETDEAVKPSIPQMKAERPAQDVTILVKPSFIRPGLGNDCTICLHHGSDIYRKLYRSERNAWMEAEEMGLIDQNNPRGAQGDQAQHPLQRAFVHEATINSAELKTRGFRK
jgi:hypothetical protein